MRRQRRLWVNGSEIRPIRVRPVRSGMHRQGAFVPGGRYDAREYPATEQFKRAWRKEAGR